MEDNARLPDYETAHTKIKNEARMKAMDKAKRMAEEYKAKQGGGEEIEIEEIEEEAAEKETD